MPKLVTPQTFIIAETKLNVLGLIDALTAMGVEDWETDTHNDAQVLTEFAGKSCYMSFSLDMNKNLTKVGGRNNHDYIQKGIIATEHGSVLEHSTVTFFFRNVSRVFTHELVRHRVGSAYSQVSGRYVRNDRIDYWLPSEIRGTPAAGYFHACFSMMENWSAKLEEIFDVQNLKDFGLKKKLTSAFRRILGNGQANHIVATFNHRTIRHLIKLRTNRHAEEEIRLVFNQVYEQVNERYPAIYADARLEMVDGYGEITFQHFDEPATTVV